MEWHVDDVLYNPPQVEVVWTLENTSDCQTMWKNEKGAICSIETDPNSLLLLEAGGAPHAVSSLSNGKRVIIKCAYALNGATFQKEKFVSQFGNKRKSLVKHKRRKKRR
mmetsp:Transcript_15418/g.35423  ORF Transcript_15418/g.35423 Transcript_15418/m.35423 type:complete len:109 (+) Transcript_15418:502-828(+)